MQGRVYVLSTDNIFQICKQEFSDVMNRNHLEATSLPLIRTQLRVLGQGKCMGTGMYCLDRSAGGEEGKRRHVLGCSPIQKALWTMLCLDIVLI